MFLTRFDGTMARRWTRQISTSGANFVTPIDLEPAPRGVLAVGRLAGDLPGHTSLGGLDGFAMRLHDSGATVWSLQKGTDTPDSFRGVIRRPQGLLLFGNAQNDVAGETNLGGYDVTAARITSFRPDALISVRSGSRYIGSDRYNSTGAGQARTARVRRGKAKVFFVRAENDGDSTDTFVVRGCRSSRGFKVTYLRGTSGRKAVTRPVTRGTYRLASIASGASKSLRMKVAVANGARRGATKTCKVSIRSVGQGSRVDAVKARVRAR
jgi:hypothetical protein